MNQRSRAIARIQRFLERRGAPRLEMAVIITATGLAGFGVSAGLLHLGLRSMPGRYSLAVGFAYIVFLILVWLWVEYRRRETKPYPEGLDLLDAPLQGGGGSPGDPSSARGGSFGGAGAQRSWDGASNSTGSQSATARQGNLPFEGALDPVSDEGCLVVILVAILAAGLCSAVWVIYAAPALMAELLLDLLLVSGLFRRLRRLEPQSWLRVAIRRTWLPFLMVFLFLLIGGALMQSIAPEADSIGDVLRMLLE